MKPDMYGPFWLCTTLVRRSVAFARSCWSRVFSEVAARSILGAYMHWCVVRPC